MKRFLILLFLFLYVYNLVGYLAVFSFLQYRIHGEVKRMLKASIPASELIHFTFHTSKLENGEYSLQWIKKNEFRYGGGMFDIVASRVSRDSTHFLCINDIQEERLFKNISNHVQRHMNDSSDQKNLDAFKDILKKSHTSRMVSFGALSLMGTVAGYPPNPYDSIKPDVPFLPPRAGAPTHG